MACLEPESPAPVVPGTSPRLGHAGQGSHGKRRGSRFANASFAEPPVSSRCTKNFVVSQLALGRVEQALQTAKSGAAAHPGHCGLLLVLAASFNGARRPNLSILIFSRFIGYAPPTPGSAQPPFPILRLFMRSAGRMARPQMVQAGPRLHEHLYAMCGTAALAIIRKLGGSSLRFQGRALCVGPNFLAHLGPTAARP